MKSLRWIRGRAYSSALRLIAEACSDMLRGDSMRSALRRMRSGFAGLRSTVGMTADEAKPIWLALLASLSSASHRLWDRKRDPNELVYEALRPMIPRLESAVFRGSRSAEAREKAWYLSDLTSSGVFYRCSEHGGCASDHGDFQGKLYVSSEWRSRCPEALLDRVAAYIEKHGILTVEEVTQGPPYLITRPNCRHSLRRVPIRSVLEGISTVRVGSDLPDTYVYSRYRAHRDRLRALLELRGVCPCEKLAKDIAHTRAYMKKWLSALNR